jgi:Lrp/AsnC family transcriptional regulator for asnA, asnC and gidA
MTPARQTKVDDTDEAIIAVLQQDGRRSYGEIGEAVGLSEAATRQRVNRLRDSGVMRIVAVTDPVALGRGVVATIGLAVSGDPRVAAARLAEIGAIEYVVITAGAYDVIVEVVCGTEEELLGVINDEIRAIDGVRDIATFMHLRTEKNVFAWGRHLKQA